MSIARPIKCRIILPGFQITGELSISNLSEFNKYLKRYHKCYSGNEEVDELIFESMRLINRGERESI